MIPVPVTSPDVSEVLNRISPVLIVQLSFTVSSIFRPNFSPPAKRVRGRVPRRQGASVAPLSPLSDLTYTDSVQVCWTVFNMSSPAAGLNTAQIAAIVASVTATVATIIGVTISIRCWIVRRRRNGIQELQKRDSGVSTEAGTISQAERGQVDRGRTERDRAKENQSRGDHRVRGNNNINDGRISAADSSRSSIWGDTGRSVVPPSIFSNDVWDSRQWPLPPGQAERYTFFSERSSLSGDDASDSEQPRVEAQQESLKTRERNIAAARRGLNAESRCESIWGLPEVGTAR
ncbi:hypothetical protein GGS26DRAFT_200616 [Hypomontagnella submonticulosa]|nr:hypothetical protein GGS26DRAFT_200616 [Hypomontagnella submonticulosa]